MLSVLTNISGKFNIKNNENHINESMTECDRTQISVRNIFSPFLLIITHEIKKLRERIVCWELLIISTSDSFCGALYSTNHLA